MKRTTVLLALTIVFSSVAAIANSNSDPRIIIKDPVCPSSSCISVGTHFSFSSPESGFGTVFFTNSSGVSWRNLKLLESVVAASAITCSSPDAFMHCSVTTSGSDITAIFLSGIEPGFLGIPAGHHFSITFGGWPLGGVEFTAVANVPEPVTLTLFASGLGVILVRRRKRLRQL
ncbi:MAG: PEP-CTERM sorting domain-containing protein [Acidobacteria bacterium]|nr:PEP-CTERM sorting domain-containing protein [Acidobacteriota bacterium]